MRKAQGLRLVVLSVFVVLLFSSLTPAQSSNEAPIAKVTPEGRTIRFSVKASVSIEGAFDKWDATPDRRPIYSSEVIDGDNHAENLASSSQVVPCVRRRSGRRLLCH